MRITNVLVENSLLFFHNEFWPVYWMLICRTASDLHIFETAMHMTVVVNLAQSRTRQQEEDVLFLSSASQGQEVVTECSIASGPCAQKPCVCVTLHLTTTAHTHTCSHAALLLHPLGLCRNNYSMGGWHRVRQGEAGRDRVKQREAGWGRAGETGRGRVSQGRWGRERQMGMDTAKGLEHLITDPEVPGSNPPMYIALDKSAS